MKKIITILLTLVLILSFSSCAKKDEYKPGDRIKALFNEGMGFNPNEGELYYSIKTSVGGSENFVKFGLKGDNFYISYNVAGENYTVLYYENASYIINDELSLIYRLSVDNQFSDVMQQYKNPMPEEITSALEADGVSLSAGEEEYNGVAYNYDKVEYQGASVTYYFDKQTDKLVYVESNDYVIEFLEYSNKCPQDLFTLPQDYNIIDY